MYYTSNLGSFARETDAALELRLELPGSEEGDAHVTVDQDVLTVRGARRLLDGRQSTFARSWRLNTPVSLDDSTATLRNGVLTVILPKHADARPREIAVRA